MSDDRQEVLDRALRGDAAARGVLFERFRPYVRRLVQVSRQGLSPARADDSDLIQDALFAANKAFDRFRGTTTAEFAGWLREVTIRVVGHVTRFHQGAGKRASGREAMLNPDGLAIPDGSSPDARAMRHEEHARIAEALERLPEDMRQLLLSRTVEGLSYREIAARTDRTEAALRIHYVRALRKLREFLT